MSLKTTRSVRPTALTTRLRAAPKKTGSKVAPPSVNLKKGDQGAAVEMLQRCLIKTRHLAKADFQTGPGIFGSRTEAALKAFQRDHALTADGKYGPMTRAALAEALGTKPKPAPTPAGQLEGLFYGDAAKGKVALTFDDGPHPVNTPKVLDILKRHKAKATFFVTGENAKRYPALIKRIVAEGHTLGAHSWHHDDQAKLTQAQVERDMRRTEKAIVAALGKPYDVTQFRPPYGSMDQEVKDAAAKLKNQAILWNVDSNDWRYSNNDQAILDNVIRRLQRDGLKIVKTDRLLIEKYGTANA